MNLSSLKLNEIRKELAKRSYFDYVHYVHRGAWIKAKHVELICNIVEQHINNQLFNDKGELVNVLILSMPPQHGKSQSITETLPSYYLGKYPSKRVIEVSYGDDLARRFGRRNKQKVAEFGKELFNIELANESRSDTEFEIKEHKGSMISRGIMAGITGQPGDLIIIDDPIKNRQEADSETYRERVWEEWLNSIKTRLSAQGKVILIMTRWHEDDLAGRLANSTESTFVLNLPCEAEENDPLGRDIGEALFPEIGKDKAWLEQFKKAYTSEQGARAWTALFQGRPSSQEGTLLKRQWWKYYDILPPIATKLISVDAAFKDKEDSDFVVVQVWGKTGSNMYLIDQVRARMNFLATLQTIRNMHHKHPTAVTKLIEDKANGSAVISMLHHEMGGIIPVNPEGGKVARVNAVSPFIESGNVYLPQNEPWVHDFVEEASSFPNGKNDDQVDCMSQALHRCIYYHGQLPESDKKPLPFPLRSTTTQSGGYMTW